jgi:hypothetical protein
MLEILESPFFFQFQFPRTIEGYLALFEYCTRVGAQDVNPIRQKNCFFHVMGDKKNGAGVFLASARTRRKSRLFRLARPEAATKYPRLVRAARFQPSAFSAQVPPKHLCRTRRSHGERILFTQKNESMNSMATGPHQWDDQEDVT